MLKRGAALAAFLSGLAVTGGAVAATKTGTFTVTVAVQSACAVTGATLDFGTYTAGQTTDRDLRADIAYSDCGPGTITLELDGGGAADVAARKLRSGTNVLNYNLYRDSNRTALFGTGTNARTATLTGVSSGIFSVFGRIPKSQAVPVGTYTDTVNITLTF
jgi:spore coat protein U-like protein